jgi:chromosome segregation ATPase
MIENLRPRVKELESVLADRAQPGEGRRRDHADATDDATSIISMIRDLQRQNDIAHRQKESLETELAETKHSLMQEQRARAELESRAKALKAKADRASRLEEECLSLQREQKQTARRLKEVTSQLMSISEERDRLAEHRARDQRHVSELERSVMDLTSQVSRLGEMAAGLDRLRKELSNTSKALAVAREESQRLTENVQSLKGKIDATEVAKQTLELELETARELTCGQNEQLEELAANLEATCAELAAMRAALTRQEADNATLVQSNEHAQRETNTLKAKIELLEEELEGNRQALREIRTAAMRTADRALEQSSGA